MSSSTLKQLHDLAKKLGLRGYSKLTKVELQQRLDNFKTAVARVAAPAPKPTSTPRKRARVPKAKPPASTVPRTETRPATPMRTAPRSEAAATGMVSPEVARQAGFATEEEKVEGAKFTRYSRALPPADLGEDIDRLPSLRQSTLCILPQKPGVLHAYWALNDGDGARADIKLRLCHGDAQALQVWDEVTIPARRGHWYFHVPETADDAVLLQLGYYEGDRFVSAIRRGIARIPNLYASTRTDRWWWIDEESFRHMYLRAGGAAHEQRLGWSASIGSPFAPRKPEERQERLAWPGGISSRTR